MLLGTAVGRAGQPALRRLVVLLVRSRQDWVPVSRTCGLKVTRSTMAATRRGSGNTEPLSLKTKIRVRGNKGRRSGDVDRVAPVDITDVAGLLAALRDDLETQEFVPLPARERMIPKGGGKLRRLEFATVRDRVLRWICQRYPKTKWAILFRRFYQNRRPIEDGIVFQPQEATVTLLSLPRCEHPDTMGDGRRMRHPHRHQTVEKTQCVEARTQGSAGGLRKHAIHYEWLDGMSGPRPLDGAGASLAS